MPPPSQTRHRHLCSPRVHACVPRRHKNPISSIPLSSLLSTAIGSTVLEHKLGCKVDLHLLLLTSASHYHCPGYAFTRFVPLSAARLSVVKLQVAARMMARDGAASLRELPSQLFEPNALCFFSLHAFHNAFARILIDFARHRWTPDANLSCVRTFLHSLLP